MGKIPRAFIRGLRRVVGRKNLLKKPTDLAAHSYDATNVSHRPQLVIRITKREQVPPILRLANRYGVPVVPRGAGTGFSGGSLAVRGGVVLLLDRLNRIIEIDPAKREAVVEPGVVTENLQLAVEELGLFYPPDPASLKISTLGGNFSENAGGPRCVSYGVTGDWVKSVLAALPDGTLVDTRNDPAMTSLLLAGEGTLGVALELRLHLMERPPATATVRALFGEMMSACDSVTEILSQGFNPSKVEFMDSETLRCVTRYLGEPPPPANSALLLIELDGSKEQVEDGLPTVSRICEKRGAAEISVARNPAEQEDLWAMRRACSPAIARIRPLKINEDVVVPRGRLPRMAEAIEGLRKKYDLAIPVFGHAGDGNLHVNIMCDPADSGEFNRAQKALDDLFTTVLALGGSLSGEHGIGLSKQPFIERELAAPIISLSRRIKRRLDPVNTLNPAKIFPSPEE
ncbi:FAD-binding protein [bacterium]|nr:FAD-binding protein [bacterium]